MKVGPIAATIAAVCSIVGCTETPTVPPVSSMSSPQAQVSAITASGYVQVSAGEYHTCALRTDGSLVCWGYNVYGQATPPAGTTFAQVSAGAHVTCAVRMDDSVVCWGRNVFDQGTLPTGTNFVQVSAGGATLADISIDHACAVRTDGSVACWGYDTYGVPTTSPGGTNFAQVSAGLSHTCAVRTDGSVSCWGSNSRGQVTPPAGTNFSQVSAGIWHTCAVRTDGSLACWGDNSSGQATPPSGANFVQVSAGAWHTCAVRTGGSLACWGRDGSGQATPPAGTSFAQVSAGRDHTCAVRTDGSLVCWGDNSYGQATPPTVTPQEAIQYLMADVKALVLRLGLSQDQALLAKLAAAIPSLDRGRTNAACNQLSAFVNQVNGLIGAKKLTAVAAQELIDATGAIRTQIGCVGTSISLADLTIGVLAETPPNPTSSDIITLSGVVSNSGGTAAGPSTVTFCATQFFPDGSMGGTCQEIPAPGVPAGGSANVSTTGMGPFLRGTYTITANVDTFNVVPESNEANNQTIGPSFIVVAPAGSDCFPSLPAPQLALENITVVSVGGVEYDKYDLDVLNRSSFPDALFAPAPTLPPCGLNTNASRTWVDIFGGDGTMIYGFCALQASDELNNIWFSLPHGQIPPPQVFIVLTDRQCGINYESNRINLP